MTSQKHIIKKQILELEIEDAGKSRQAQNRLSQLVKKQLTPLIDRICDELSPPGQLNRIDRLEIDLGEIPLDQLEKMLPHDFEKVFRQELAKAIDKQTTKFLTVQYPSSSNENQHLPPVESLGGNGQTKPEDKSKHTLKSSPPVSSRANNALLFFLKTGRLPWWIDKEARKSLLSQWQKEDQAEPEKRFLHLQPYLAEPALRQRLILHSTNERLFQLITPTLTPATASFWKAWVKLLSKSATSWRLSPAQLRYQIWEELFYLLSYTPTGKITPPLLTTRTIVTVAKLQNQSPAAVMKQVIAEARQTAGKQLLNTLEKMTRSAERLFKKTAQEMEEDKQMVQKQRPARKARFRYDDSEEIFVGNAGLVILAPYLPRLFQIAGLMNEEGFRDEKSRHRALWLLQYLADGAAEAPEYQLPLNKLLCGLPVSEAVLPLDPLTEAEREAADRLLQAVILNAPILGEMAADTFRYTFLQREGILRAKDDYWLLQVQYESYDIVLERLPWSYNLIKLSWMQQSIYVEW